MIEKIFAALAVGDRGLDPNSMAIAIALTLMLAGFFVALGLQISAMSHWFTAWLLGALFLPAIMLASELLYPTGWLGGALIVGGLANPVAAGLGMAAGWVILRRKTVTVHCPDDASLRRWNEAGLTETERERWIDSLPP